MTRRALAPIVFAAALLMACPAHASLRVHGREIRVARPGVLGPTHLVVGRLVRSAGAPRSRAYAIEAPSGRGPLAAVHFGGVRLPPAADNAVIRARVTRAGRVRRATITAPVQRRATVVPSAQRAYVARVVNRGTYPDDDTTIKTTIQNALTRWQQESNGAITGFTIADFQDFTTTTDCSDGGAMYNEAATKLFPTISFGSTSGNHLIVIGPLACAGGVGTIGAGINSGGRLNVNYNPAKNPTSLMHELGHNFSLEHAHACYPAGPSCTVSDYGNHYSFMGVSVVHTPAYTPAGLDSFERTRLGITDPGEVDTIAPAGGSATTVTDYDLHARGSSSGLRGLRITDPGNGAVYSIDWRSGGGRDALSYYPTSLAAAQDEWFNPGVTVEQVGADGDSATVQAYAKPDPADGDTFGLTVGKAFSAGNVEVEVDALGDSSDPDATATVTVTLTNVADTTATPTPTPTPDPTVTDTPTAPVTSTVTPTASPVPTTTSTATPTAAPAAEQSGRVAIAGAPGVGTTVTATPVDWTAGAFYVYQWFDGTMPIAGATAATFRIPRALRDHRLSVGVTGVAPGYADHLAFAPPVLVGRFLHAPRPRIAGRHHTGHRVHAVAHQARWSPPPTRLRYRWYAGRHRLRGARTRTLTLTPRLVGKRLRVRVTGSRPGFARKTVRSRPTVPLA